MTGAKIKNNLKMFLSKFGGRKKINNNMINLSGLDLTNLHSHKKIIFFSINN